MPIEWKLRELLDQQGLSVYALAEQMGGGSGGASKRPGLYAITSSDPDKRPTRVSFELLSELLTALCELTGEEIEIADVLEFIPDREIADMEAILAGLLGSSGLAEPAMILADMSPPDHTQTEGPKKRGRPKGSRNKRKSAGSD